MGVVKLKCLGPSYLGSIPGTLEALEMREGAIKETTEENAERLMRTFPGRFELVVERKGRSK